MLSCRYALPLTGIALGVYDLDLATALMMLRRAGWWEIEHGVPGSMKFPRGVRRREASSNACAGTVAQGIKSRVAWNHCDLLSALPFRFFASLSHFLWYQITQYSPLPTLCHFFLEITPSLQHAAGSGYCPSMPRPTGW
jgi:hypothetical protein